MLLAGDVGATKILLEVGEIRSRTWTPALAKRYESGDVSFSEAVGQFLEEWRSTARKPARITAAAFGAAGPRAGNSVKMTNRPWSVDGDAVANGFGIPKVKIVNDLEASARGLELLPERELKTIQAGRAVEGAPRVVMGVGTGLGVAYLIACGKRYRAVAGEGGHATFAPVAPRQVELAQAIRGAKGRVSNEDIVSGAGLARIYEFQIGRAHV